MLSWINTCCRDRSVKVAATVEFWDKVQGGRVVFMGCWLVAVLRKMISKSGRLGQYTNNEMLGIEDKLCTHMLTKQGILGRIYSTHSSQFS